MVWKTGRSAVAFDIGKYLLEVLGKLYAFSALTLLDGRQEEHLACKN